MFGAIDAGILFDIMRKDGYMYQMSLPLTPPEYTLPESYFEDVQTGYARVEEHTGSESSSIQSVNHPGFTRLRDELEAKGYIKTERGWHNGDRVLKRFKLNDHWFEEREQFPCASAMRGHLKLPWMSNLRYKTDYKTKAVEMILTDYEFEKLGDLFDRDMVDIEKIKIEDDKGTIINIKYKITSKQD